jgi:hypothetical protein
MTITLELTLLISCNKLALVKMILARLRFGRVIIQRSSQFVDTGPSHLKDMLLKTIVMMIKIQDPHQETWEIREAF